MTDEAFKPTPDTPQPGAEKKLSPEEEYIRLLESRLRGGTAEGEQAAIYAGEETVRPEPVCCRFERAGQHYHVPVEYVLEIAEMPKLTQLPLSPDYLVGLINLRGECVPVIDLARIDGGATVPPIQESEARLLIADAGAETLAFMAEGMPYLSPEEGGKAIEVVDFVRQYRVGAVDG